MTPEEYYSKQKSPQKEICLKLRQIIKDTYPNLTESMLWGVPVFENGLFYIVALKNHVNLGFSIANLTPKEKQVFQGGGKTTRKIELETLEDIDSDQIIKLLKFVAEKIRT